MVLSKLDSRPTVSRSCWPSSAKPQLSVSGHLHRLTDSPRQIAEWVGDLDEYVRRRFGGGRGAPSVATIRRVVLGVDPDLLDAVLTAWVSARAPGHDHRDGLVCVAVDGKSARGARRPDGRAAGLARGGRPHHRRHPRAGGGRGEVQRDHRVRALAGPGRPDGRGRHCGRNAHAGRARELPAPTRGVLRGRSPKRTVRPWPANSQRCDGKTWRWRSPALTRVTAGWRRGRSKSCAHLDACPSHPPASHLGAPSAHRA